MGSSTVMQIVSMPSLQIRNLYKTIHQRFGKALTSGFSPIVSAFCAPVVPQKPPFMEDVAGERKAEAATCSIGLKSTNVSPNKHPLGDPRCESLKNLNNHRATKLKV